MSILASLVFPFTNFGQTLDEVVKVGNRSFDTKDYYKAFRLYEKVLEYVGEGRYKGDWDSLYIKYRYAEAARQFNNYEAADSMYTVLCTESLGQNMDVYARSTFNLAQVKKSLAEEIFALNKTNMNRAVLEKARQLYQEFLDNNLRQHLKAFPASGKDDPEGLSPEDKLEFDKRAAKGIADCNAAIRAADENPGGIVLEKDTISRLSDVVNSEYSDLAPVLIGNELYFSSVKFPSGTTAHNRQSRTYSEVLKATFSGDGQGGLGAVLSLDTLAQSGLFNDGNDFSHTVHTAITHNGTWMYFSHCPQGSGESPSCKLYRRENKGGAWGDPEPMDSINADGANTAQPSISYDSQTGAQWLYFASDRAETKGGLDIWRCQVNEADGSLAEPEHLSDVNSEWNDATPFYHALSDRLFFSSDRGSTFGLYDNFVWESCGSEKIARNLGLPYNSGFNDQYYFLTEGGERAFFSSDRPESTRFIDSLDACCQDIFTYPIDNSMELEIEVLGCNEENITSEAEIKIYDITICGCREKAKEYFEEKGRKFIEGTLVKQEDGSFKYIATVNRYHNYRIFASQEEFETGSANIALDCEYDGRKQAALPPIQLSPAFVDLTFVVHDKITELPLELEDYSLVFASEDAPAPEEVGKQTFRLFPKSNYTLNVKAEQSVYKPFTLLLDSVRLTKSCTDIIHVELEKRCEAPPALEGIAFFFDNDKPDRIRKSEWKTTNQRYNAALVDPYFAQWKDNNKKFNYLAFNLKPYVVNSWADLSGKVRFDELEGGRTDTLMNLITDNSQANLDRESLRYKVEKRPDGKFNITPDTTLVEGRIDRFFERDLKGDLERFDSLITYIKEYLETGSPVRVTMQAFCSVRVSGIISDYNAALAERRILCIRKTMEEALEEKWKGVSRAERQRYGKLIFLPPDAVSDKGAARIFPDPNLDPDKDEGGTYFLSAALDRRVQINKIEFGECGGDETSSTKTKTKNPGQP